jgi:hypothetical protein
MPPAKFSQQGDLASGICTHLLINIAAYCKRCLSMDFSMPYTFLFQIHKEHCCNSLFIVHQESRIVHLNLSTIRISNFILENAISMVDEEYL